VTSFTNNNVLIYDKAILVFFSRYTTTTNISEFYIPMSAWNSHDYL